LLPSSHEAVVRVWTASPGPRRDGGENWWTNMVNRLFIVNIPVGWKLDVNPLVANRIGRDLAKLDDDEILKLK
jgi:hypothetical protein